MIFFFIELTLIIFLSVFESIYDIKNNKVNLILIGLLSAVIFVIRIFSFSLEEALLFLLQGLATSLFYLIIYFTSNKKIGFGDIIFGFFTGICIYKWHFLWISVAVTVLTLILFLLIRLIKKINLTDKKLPFIPFMSAGLLTAFILSYFL